MPAEAHVGKVTLHQLIPHSHPGRGQDLGARGDLITVLGYEGGRVLRDVGAPSERADGIGNGCNGHVHRTDAAAVEIKHQPKGAQKGEHAAIRMREAARDHQGLAEQNRQAQILLPPMQICCKRPGLKGESHRVGTAGTDVALVDIVACHQGHEQQRAETVSGQAAEDQRPGQQPQ